MVQQSHQLTSRLRNNDETEAQSVGFSQLVDEVRQMSKKVDELLGQLSGKVKAYYSSAEAADLTSRSSYTVRRWISEGKIKAVRVNGTGPKGRLLIPREELEKLL